MSSQIAVSTSSLQVLLVEDNPADVRLMHEMAHESSERVIRLTHAGSLSAAADVLKTARFDVALLDLSLPGSHGLETVRRFRESAPAMPVVVMSSMDDEQTALNALAQGAQDYLVKGLDGQLRVVLRALRYAIERHRIGEELARSQNCELEVKNRFISHVSHELRGPLASSYLAATNLLDGFAGLLSEEQRNVAQAVLRNINRLRFMIDELLDATRCESGKMRLAPHDFSMGLLVAEAVGEAMRSTTDLAWRQDVAPDLPPAHGDAQRIMQVLRNLIDNAVKFSPAGAIITVRALADPETCGAIAGSQGEGST